MYKKIAVLLWFPLLFIVTSCASSAEITIEPYTVNNQEQLLINQTGIGNIEYFKMNGKLDDSLDIQFSVESYKDGELKETLFSTEDEIMRTFKNDILSFGIREVQEEEDSFFEVISGTSSSLISVNYYEQKGTTTFNNLISEKVTLKKNTPIYLAVWVATENNNLPSIGGNTGKFPKEVEEVERALVYKVVVTEK